MEAVENLCAQGEEHCTQNYCFFPTFTRHDYKHILNVCFWMYKLLDGMAGSTKAVKALTAEEAALLLLTASWHDSGMAVSAEQREALAANMNARAGDWPTYFQKHPKDEVDLANQEAGAVERVLRNYVRERHAARCVEQLPAEADWPDVLVHHGIERKTVIDICASHGEWLKDLRLKNDDTNFDLRLCVVLLRLADILDYDASRAPEVLFRFLGLDHPTTAEEQKSREEWDKNKKGFFDKIVKGAIIYRAKFDDAQTEHGVMEYLKSLRGELDACQKYLLQSKRWSGFVLPHVQEKITRKGYDGGDFHITMDQDRVVELLTGNNLYEDAGVFVRELLQNSIDAVLERRRQDPNFGEDAGHIVVRCWQDNEGYGWFRIEDDGTGMNEHIIKDYFLKVGRSYYDSDEYRAASLHPARETGDKPTSRFGIGILSAFMTDPKHTTLEVLTRRYDEQMPLRLDVTGLHGYYSLTRVTRERPGLPMHTPNGLQHEPNRGVGTTVCVRVNRYRLGYCSFRELLDKYVVFPEVRVTYSDQQETKDYPTQQELMDAVHKVAGTTHVHPLPDEQFSRVRERFPEWLWAERPALTLTFHSLDTLTEDISGVAAEVGFRGSAAWVDSAHGGKEDYVKISLLASINRVEQNIQLAWRYFGHFLHSQATLQIYSIHEIMQLLPTDERQVFQYVLNATQTSRAVVAFNGAVADRVDLLKRDSSYFGVVLLLRGEGCPKVNLARNVITELPLDTLCALSLLQNELTNFLLSDELLPFRLDRFALLPKKDWFNMLQRHPELEARIRCGGKTLSKLEANVRKMGEFRVPAYFRSASFSGWLRLAALNRRFCYNITRTGDLRLCSRPKSPIAEELPISLFAKNDKASKSLVEIKRNYINIYSETHPFSQWLLQQQDTLREEARPFYDNLLSTMVLGNDADDIRRELNDILDRLRNFDGNPFQVPADLRLTEDDFA